MKSQVSLLTLCLSFHYAQAMDSATQADLSKKVSKFTTIDARGIRVISSKGDTSQTRLAQLSDAEKAQLKEHILSCIAAIEITGERFGPFENGTRKKIGDVCDIDLARIVPLPFKLAKLLSDQHAEQANESSAD